ncbi:hypothetical protein F5Y19DRAFT_408566 [Xylariaceae sp. FL1651]|nr:hypothetical protein F5Y19DRAFT_408566 [Xylariaceae sp. FL1651]
MSAAWLTLPVAWDFANVQATLNIIISVLGTLAIWSFSRIWYQHGSSKIISRNNVALSSLCTVTSPGEAWDVFFFFKTRILEAQLLPLLTQGLVVILITAATILAGPIARFSLKTANVVLPRRVNGLLGEGGNRTGIGTAGSIITGNVVWNSTINSLNAANFSYDQLLEYLPSSTTTWVYRAAEWNSTWSMQCDYTEETHLDINPNSTYSITDPIHAFPEFRETYDPLVLNFSKYRYSSDFCGWTQNQPGGLLKAIDVSWFVLLETEPTIDDQFVENQRDLHITLSVLTLHNTSFGYRNYTYGDRGTYVAQSKPERASYTRVDCRVSRAPNNTETLYVAQPWTNDTASIVKGYADFYRLGLVQASASGRSVSPLPPLQILRFYQAYMVTFLVLNELPVVRTLSVQYTATQLSAILLVAALLVSLFILGASVRYLLFNYRYKHDLSRSQIPDAKLDWMLHAFKNSKHVGEEDLGLADCDMFKAATYETIMRSDTGVSGLAKVYSRGQTKNSVKTVAVVTSLPVHAESVESDDFETERKGSLLQSSTLGVCPQLEIPQIQELTLLQVVEDEIKINEEVMISQSMEKAACSNAES